MAITLSVRGARTADAALLAPVLRLEDAREIQAVYAEGAHVVLERGIAQSRRCYAVVDPTDAPLALFGVISATRPGLGIPWMVASTTLASHAPFVVRNARKYLTLLQEGYAELWNCLDARNGDDLRWVEWCGFTRGNTIPEYGVERRPFVAFSLAPGGESLHAPAAAAS